jgi:outer membrane immunogenic protein
MVWGLHIDRGINMRNITTALLATTALFAAFAQSASAADLRAPAYRAPPPPPPPAFSWTGLYLGGHGGCAHDRKNYTTGGFRNADPGEVGSGFGIDTANGGGCYGGLQIGYNYQVGSWVWGVEADGSWGNIRSKTTLLELDPGEVETLALYDQKLKSFGTVRGRLGYAWTWGATPTLWYVTGGYAWARNELSTTALDGIQNTLVSTQNHSGYAVGTGIEVALGWNWSFKGEYLFMDLGNKTYATALITDDGALPGTNTTNVDLKLHTVRIGLNYRFGGYGAY